MPAGRPEKYSNATEVQAIIDQYFTDCEINDEPLLISGLAYALDMTTETLRQYGKKEKFSSIIRRARQRVEMYLEKSAVKDKSPGAMFNLKCNFNWREVHYVEEKSERTSSITFKPAKMDQIEDEGGDSDS